MVFFGPPLLFAMVVVLLFHLIRRVRSRGKKPPRPVNRYLK